MYFQGSEKGSQPEELLSQNIAIGERAPVREPGETAAGRRPKIMVVDVGLHIIYATLLTHGIRANANMFHNNTMYHHNVHAYILYAFLYDVYLYIIIYVPGIHEYFQTWAKYGGQGRTMYEIYRRAMKSYEKGFFFKCSLFFYANDVKIRVFSYPKIESISVSY